MTAPTDALLDEMVAAGAFSPEQRDLCAGLLERFSKVAETVIPDHGAVARERETMARHYEAVEKFHRDYHVREPETVVVADYATVELRALAHMMTRAEEAYITALFVGKRRISPPVSPVPVQEGKKPLAIFDEMWHVCNQPLDLPPIVDDNGSEQRRKQAKLTFKDRANESRDAKAAMRERALAKLAKKRRG